MRAVVASSMTANGSWMSECSQTTKLTAPRLRANTRRQEEEEDGGVTARRREINTGRMVGGMAG